MIGKAKSISHTVNAVNYAMKKPGAKEISRNKVAGETPREIATEFRIFQNLNSKCGKNTFSMVLSPSIPDGDKLSNSDFAKLAGDFLFCIPMRNTSTCTFSLTVLILTGKHTRITLSVKRRSELLKVWPKNGDLLLPKKFSSKKSSDWATTLKKPPNGF